MFMQLIIEYKIFVIKSTAIRLYGFRKKMCFHETRILNFFVDMIMIIKFRFFIERHSQKKRFRMHHIRFVYLSTTCFLNLQHYIDML